MKREISRSVCIAVLSLAVFCACRGLVSAAAAPFSEDFNDGVANGFVEFNGGWSVEDADGAGPGAGVYRHSAGLTGPTPLGSTRAIYSSAVNLDNVAGSAFTLSTTFRLDELSVIGLSGGNQITVGFGALGLASNFGATTTYYAAEVLLLGPDAGQLRISQFNGFGPPADPIAAGASGVPINANGSTVYQLTLDGSYGLGGELTLRLTLSNGITSGSVEGIDATPLAGNFFGFRNSVQAGAPANQVSLDMNYDNFQVIPEPGVGTLLMLGGVLASGARFARRRSQKPGIAALRHV